MVNLRRSLVINFFSSSGAALLQFIVSVLLARMLSPSEIGVYSMTLVFVNFAHVFRDFGVSTYLKREPDLTPEKIRSATGVVFATSWFIGGSMLLASNAIGRWFEEPDIIPVMQVLAVGFFLIPFGAVTNAMLSREFAAEKQAVVQAVGTISFCITCLTLAKLGFGSMSLAWGNLVNIIACAIALVPFRPKNLPWLPSLHHWRSVAHFGVGSLISSCIGALNNAIPDILLGKLGSAREVGLLSRANSTVTIFSYVAGSTVSYGALSYLSQAHYRGESLTPIMSRATVLLTGIGWPALALTAVLGHDIILALYGPNWLPAVPAIAPLVLAAAVGMMFHYVPIGVMAIGRPYLSAVPTTVGLLARIGFGLALYDGSLSTFAWALCLATIVTAPVNALQQRSALGVDNGHMLRSMVPSLIVTIGTVLPAMLMAWLLPASLPSMARLLIMALPLAAIWYLLLRVTRHAMLEEVHRLAAPVKARLMRLLPNV